MLAYTLGNQAEYAIIPMADILGLGEEGHINTPGTIGSPNWEWHLPDFAQAEKELCFLWPSDCKDRQKLSPLVCGFVLGLFMKYLLCSAHGKC